MELRYKIKEIPQLGTPKRVIAKLPSPLIAEALEHAGADLEKCKAELEVELTRDHDEVIAHGRMRIFLILPCSRCVEPATVKVNAPFDAIFAREGAEPNEPADVEALLEAPDTFTHDGVSIDLSEACREILIAELPLAPKCASSCKGLCATCGANLNPGSSTAPCGHPPPEPASESGMKKALAGLGDLKIS